MWLWRLRIPPGPSFSMSANCHACFGCNGRLPICIGTDCTGLGSVFIALNYLNVPYRHLFGSEIDDWAQRQLLHTFPPEYCVSNMVLRSTRDVPIIDLYCCGFPCQAFSTAGNQAGFNCTSANGDGSLFSCASAHRNTKVATDPRTRVTSSFSMAFFSSCAFANP